VKGVSPSGERPASEADAKRGRESGQGCENTPDRLNQSGSEKGGQAAAARSAARPAALPCLNSHNSGSREQELTLLRANLALGDENWQTCEEIRAGESAARRRAYKLGHDMEGFFTGAGIEHVLMLELTHGHDGPRSLAKKWDRMVKNGALPWLRDWGRIVEPHKSGAAHYHMVVEGPLGMDVRTGFDFDALRQADEAAQRKDWKECAKWTKIYSASAQPWLRAQWRRLKRILPKYGFGTRFRLVPVRTCGTAVAKYVAKYLSKCLGRDLGPEWKGTRRVEWSRKHAYRPRRKVSSQFAWAGLKSGNGPKFRRRVGQMAQILGLENDDLKGLGSLVGTRWAFHWGGYLRGSDEEFARFLEELPFRSQQLIAINRRKRS
jgi:hypothetical protein